MADILGIFKKQKAAATGPSMLETEVMSIFGKMRTECYADVKGVEYSEAVPLAAIDFGSDKILINPKSFANFEKKGMTPQEIVKGYLQHEYFGHKANHPFDVKRIVAEDIALSQAGLDETTRNYARNRFDDLVGNLKVWNSHDADELRKLYSSFESTSKFDDVEKMFYQDVTGRDFGAKATPESQTYAKKLSKIDLLSGTPIKPVRESIEQVVEFYETIKPLVDEMKNKEQKPFDGGGGNNKKGKQQQQQGEGGGMGGNGSGQNLSDISPKDIEKAVKELMEEEELGTDGAKKFLKRYAEEKNEADKKKGMVASVANGKGDQDGKGDCGVDDGSLGGAPGGVFLDNPDVYASKAVYNTLSERYTLKIKKLPVEHKGGAYPCGYESWSSSDPPHEIDPFTSFGVMAPGITKKVERKGLNAFGTCDKTPDLLILLDDSGSMPKPLKDVSYAVLSAFVAAKNYVRNGSEVAAMRFSDRTTIGSFSRDEGKVIDELLKFKNGGDTHVDLPAVEETVSKGRKSKKDLDAILISDGQIDNKKEAIAYLSDFSRAFMFEIGTSGKPEKRDRVTVYHVSKDSDISKIVIDEVL